MRIVLNGQLLDDDSVLEITGDGTDLVVSGTDVQRPIIAIGPSSTLLNGSLSLHARILAAEAAAAAGGVADGSITAAKLASSAVTAAKVDATLKPSGSAATTDESLRKLGTTAGTAFAGNGTLDTVAAPAANLSLNSKKITNLATPTAAADAATKAYADAITSGLQVKASVRVATTANITLSGTQTIDGVAVVAGNRVLVKDQSSAATNGIYDVAAGAWSRSTDSDTSGEVLTGMFALVTEGTTNQGSGWILITPATITLGVTALTFTQFTSSGGSSIGTSFTAKGGELIATGAGTYVELAVGTNGQVRVADSGQATGQRWATPTPPSIYVPLVSSSVPTTPTASATSVAPSYFPGAITRCDLTGCTQVKFAVMLTTGGVVGTIVRPRYSVDGGTNWAYLENAAGTGLAMAADVNDLNTVPPRIQTSWVTLNSQAAAEISVVVVFYTTGATPTQITARQICLIAK